MPPIYETGHAVNLGNFGELITQVTTIGATYNPSNANIKLAGLTAKKTACTNAIAAVNTALVPWKTAVNDRQLLFETLRTLTLRSFAALKSSGASPAIIDDAKLLRNQIVGRRTTPLPAPAGSGEGEEPTAESVSTSHVSFDQRLAHFTTYVELLAGVAAYNPAEADIKVLALQTFITSVNTSNTNVDTKASVLKTKIIARDVEFYDEVTGLIQATKQTKDYVKSIVGPSSPTYQYLNSLRFRKIVRR